MLSNPARLAAALRASEAADAIGLNYRHSRAMLWKILHSQVKEPPPSAYLAECFSYGRWAEPWTKLAYGTVLGAPVYNSRTYFRKLGGEHEIAATPDAEAEGCLVELKSKMRYSEMPDEPKAAHVAQAVVQMFCGRFKRSDLFYFNLWDGEYRLFRLHWHADGWSLEVRCWLNEYFSYVDKPPARMPNGEADRRTTILLFAFWWDRHGTAAQGIGALKRHRGASGGAERGQTGDRHRSAGQETDSE